VDLETVADELYGLRPEEFTAARNERARAARSSGDRRLAARIAALRRPSLAAWASNLLVRGQRSEVVEPLLRLGEALRAAQDALDGEQLRELTRQQRQLVTALGREAMRLAAGAGHPIGEAVQREVEQTLRAVLADPDAAREWSTGRLTQPLTAPTGFTLTGGLTGLPGGADETDGTAGAAGAALREPPRRRPTAKKTAKAAEPKAVTDLAEQRRRRELTCAREAAEQAGRDLSTREDEHARAGRELADAEAERHRLDDHIADLTARLDEARGEQRTARGHEETLRRRLRETGSALRKAERRARDTTAHLARLTGDQPPR
jgi:hypothetical protein